jgi:hypothetical protein
LFRSAFLDLAVRLGNNRAKVATAIDKCAATDLKEWADAEATACSDFIEEFGEDEEDENGSEQRGAAGEVARPPEATDR